jgi:hypothetical protein
MVYRGALGLVSAIVVGWRILYGQAKCGRLASALVGLGTGIVAEYAPLERLPWNTWIRGAVLATTF